MEGMDEIIKRLDFFIEKEKKNGKTRSHRLLLEEARDRIQRVYNEKPKEN